MNFDDFGKTFDDMRACRDYEYITGYFDTTINAVTVDKVVRGSEHTTADIFQRCVDELPSNSCRYVVYNFRYYNPEEGIINKLVLILW